MLHLSPLPCTLTCKMQRHVLPRHEIFNTLEGFGLTPNESV